MLKPCITCHEEKEDLEFRKDRNQCKLCIKAYDKAYHEAHREQIKDKVKAYREAHREQSKAHDKAYYEANREKIKASQKAYYEANREKIKASQKAYYEAHRERIKAYREAHRERSKAHYHKRRARKRAVSGTYHKNDILFLLNVQKGKCLCCRTLFPTTGNNRFHVDHVIPLAHGQLTAYNSVDNLQILCPTCNLSKGVQTIDYRSNVFKRKLKAYLQQKLFSKVKIARQKTIG